MKSQALKSNIYNLKAKPKVYVGLSGGVDSAVSAALLQKEGYDVTGVFIKAWSVPGQPLASRSFSGVGCTWKEDRRRAMRAAAILDIPFITLDLEKEYKKQVVDYMIAEYKKGRTPNPDVMCNKEIKFGEFLKFALKNGADFIATGHYAKKLRAKSLKLKEKTKSLNTLSSKLQALSYVLSEAKDKNKDQSYFLWTLTQDQLKHILFPVGGIKKNEVRQLAERFNLPQAERKDSQGICFLGQVDMKEFLKDFLKPKKGKVLLASRSFSEVGNENGEEIGEHDGALLYTIGERHGFRIWNKDTEREPMYVVAKDVKKNTITVSNQSVNLKVQNYSLKFKIQNTNFINEEPKGEIECRYRYRQDKIKCEVVNNEIVFQEPQLIAPGQSIVFYLPRGKAGDNEICLGGAIIS